MNYGKFFRLNNEKSDLSKGITVFDYIWLCDNENGNDSSEFPVYVTLSKDSIDFHVHYHEDYTENNKHIHKHLHNTILSLPLSANIDVKDGLTSALVEGFETNFPRYNKEGSNLLFSILCKVIKNNNDDAIVYSRFEIFKNLAKPSSVCFLKKIFSKENDIIEFPTKGELRWIDFDKEVKELIDKIQNGSACDYYGFVDKHNRLFFNRFIRKLILDFMFDLELTKVFQTSPHYEHISVKLKENYFFSALAAKANFYYWLEIYKENKEQPVSTEYCIKSAIEWRKHIRNPQSEQAFCGWQKEGWFEDPVREMRNVYKKKEIDSTKSNDILKQTYENEIEESKKWSVANYDFLFWGRHLFCMPRIAISIIGAWLTFILGTALWGNAKSTDSQGIYDDFCWQLHDSCGINSFALGFCLLLIVGTFLWLKHKGTVTKIRKKKSTRYWWASIWMTVLGFIYSVIIGYGLTLFSFSHPWKEGEIRSEHFLSCTPFHESYYWIGVCLSLFISLVVQSFMNDNKSPADEL